MTLKYYLIVLFSVFVTVSKGQLHQTGFDNAGNSIEGIFDTDYFYAYADSVNNNSSDLVLLGLKSTYRDYVDSALIQVNGKEISILQQQKGIYTISKKELLSAEKINLKIHHPDYHVFDTLLSVDDLQNNKVLLSLNPQYKMTFRGRVYSANTPMAGVKVTVIYRGDSINLFTKDCFYDRDDYWNCLFFGMFKYQLTIINPEDEVTIVLNKEGYEEQIATFKVSDYKGEIAQFKLYFDDKLPKIYRHNIAVKFTFPLISESNWFAGFGYLYTLKLNKFNRLALGAEGSILMKNYQYTYATFNGAPDAVSDSTYLVGFAGPTAVLWLTNPIVRKYSIYTGATYAYMFTNSSFNFQPFIGGRFFIDLNKAISFDVRYMNYDMDVVQYEFNPTGAANRFVVNKPFEEIMISIGLHIGF